MARSRNVLVPRGGSRRRTSWGVGPGSGTTTNQVSATGTLLPAGATLTDDGLTLIRTRGVLDMQITDSGTPAATMMGAVGIGVVTSEAFAIGATAVPLPVTDDQWDGWLYHWYFSLWSANAINGGSQVDTDAINTNLAHVRFEVDSKAMRKIDFNETIMACLEVIETGTSIMNWSFRSRTLVKLT